MKRIVIICASGLKNSGDEAILAAILQKFRSDSFDISVSSLDPDYTAAIHGVEVVRDKKSLHEKLDKADLVIFGGGGLLQDETTIFNVYRWLSKLKRPIRKKRRIIVYANSVGPIRFGINRFLIRWFLERVSIITLRDVRSRDLLINLGICPSKIHVTADPVFGLTPEKEESVNGKAGKVIADKFIIFALRHWYDTHPFLPVKFCTRYNIRFGSNQLKYDRLVNELQSFVRYINDQLDLRVIFLSFCHGRDVKIARDVAEGVLSSKENKIIDEAMAPPQFYFDLIRRCEFVVGMRLHSIIYSIICKRKFIALAYSEKVKGLLELAGLPDLVVDIDTFSAERAIELVDNHLLGSVGQEIEQRIKVFCDGARAEDHRNFDLGMSLFEN